MTNLIVSTMYHIPAPTCDGSLFCEEKKYVIQFRKQTLVCVNRTDMIEVRSVITHYTAMCNMPPILIFK